MFTLSEILPYFGGNKAELARALKISKQAVSRWSSDGPIPEAQALKLKYEILPGMQDQEASKISAAE